MKKVYLICGKICSGKSYYAKKLQKEINGVILSPDEATYDLIKNEQGPFYDEFSKRLLNYFNKKSIEIVNAGANVIYERGLWSKQERDEIKKFYQENKVEFEIHYIHIDEEKWNKQIEKRNKYVLENGGTDFYLDEGLKKKLESLFEEPNQDEVDVWIENKY